MTHRRGTLEIFINHFNNAAGNRSPGPLRSAGVLLYKSTFPGMRKTPTSTYYPKHPFSVPQFCDTGVTIISPQVADNIDSDHSQDSLRVQKQIRQFHTVAYICPSITSDTVATR